MPESVAWIKEGPDTFEVNVTVAGGQLVEPDAATGKIKPAVVDSVKWLGVALYRAEPATTTGEDTVWDEPRVDFSVPRPEVAVAFTGTFKLLAAEAINFGEVVYCGAAGTVQNATVTGRPVGVCTEPLGIANGARGRIRLFS